MTNQDISLMGLFVLYVAEAFLKVAQKSIISKFSAYSESPHQIDRKNMRQTFLVLHHYENIPCTRLGFCVSLNSLIFSWVADFSWT